MKQMVLGLDLVDDPAVIAQYDKVHRPGGPPAAVTASIRAAGIHRMDIFRVVNRLVMIVEADDDFVGFGNGDAATSPIGPDLRAWDSAMAAMQRAIPGSDTMGWAEMSPVYRLDDQP